MKLLHVDSSVLAANSVSRQLTARIVAQWQATHPGTTVEYLDLGANAPAHFGPESLGYRLGIDASQLTEAQKRENAVTDAFLTQFLAADVIVVGAPLYNFTIPSQLKAWFDRIMVAGKTFRYSESGPEGLCTGKKVIVVSTAGGLHVGQPTGVGHEELLKALFGFIGITEVKFVRAHGLAYGDEPRAQALHAAQQDIEETLLA